MFERKANKPILEMAQKYPVVAIIGPRQSGKTTLVKACLPQKPYVSLENPDQLEFATNDPNGFLRQYPEGAVLDEIQRAPKLFSYIQGIVDEKRQMGFFILIASQQFLLLSNISQSLAGRVSFIDLLPMSIDELAKANKLPASASEVMFMGGYPALYERDVSPIPYFDDYIRTYVERDVRQIKAIQNLAQFQTFLRLCAGRIGGVLDVNSLASDCGISPHTAESWLAVLEASYIIFRLRPHHKNFSKRLIKRPKLYFNDSGLACRLMGIRSPEELSIHSLKGGLFESMIISDLRKAIFNSKSALELYFWRDHKGFEIDVIIDKGLYLTPVEIKSSQTISQSFFVNLNKFSDLAQDSIDHRYLIFAGEDFQERSAAKVLPWRRVSQLISTET